MSRSQKKAERLLQIEALLLAHPEGLTPSELARKLQVNRSTIGRYLPELPKHIYIDNLDSNRWKIDRAGYLVNVRFNLHETLAIHIATRLLATHTIHQYTFAPYFIEPYAVGQTTHVIGQRTPPGTIRTFKIERIERIEMTTTPFDIPANFNPSHFLANAWGIWYTETEPKQVVLRFSRHVAQRVQETRWHRSQEVAQERDGHLLWRAWVAEPQEMLPWIRGWGADVEIIEPDTLRHKMMGEARQLAQLYGWHTHRGTNTTATTPSLQQTFQDFFGGES